MNTTTFTLIDGTLKSLTLDGWVTSDLNWSAAGLTLKVEGFATSSEADEDGVWDLVSQVYVPRAVAFLNATHEGGGGIEETQEYALRMGAKELKMGEQGLLVATWPQEYWEIEAGQECPCGARGCAGRPKGGYKPSVRRV